MLAFQQLTKEAAMKKIIMLAIVLATILVSLGGCFWVEPWHGEHEHGHYHHYYHRDREYDERR